METRILLRRRWVTTALIFIAFILTIRVSTAARGSHIDEAFSRAVAEVRHLYNSTEPELFDKYELYTHMPYARNAWLSHTYSSDAAKQRAFVGYVLLRTTQLLSSSGTSSSILSYPKVDFLHSGLCHRLNPADCPNSMYRTADGSCNNAQNPSWGSTFAAFRRELPASYADGISEFRQSAVDGSALMNARVLSNAFFGAEAIEVGESRRANSLTAMFTHWAMFVYTDMVHIGSGQIIRGNKHVPLPCCEEPTAHPECRPIAVESADPFYNGFVGCLDYPRSLIASPQHCNLGPREQANHATSFLDASNVYGSTAERQNELRAFNGGKMKISADSSYPKPMPLTIEAPFGASKCPDGLNCFISGSEHTNFLPTLVALHSVWLRQHNRIAEEMARLNPRWTDEQLYQESRRFVVAQIQHITYTEFLPLMIGREAWHRYGMIPQSEALPTDDAYSMDVDPSVSNEYAAVVGQFFYTMLGNSIAQYHNEGFRTAERPLSDYINKPRVFLFGEDIDGVLRFLLRDSPEPFGLHLPPDIRGRLFKGTTNMGLDLAAMLIQTGRDHGIAPYIAWRRLCGGSPITSFDELHDELLEPERVIPLLRKYFKSIRDVDLLILGLAERPARGAVLGPTFACIAAKQFRNTKYGDRFWYESTVARWGFSGAQLAELKKSTLADVLCANTGLQLVQPHLFQQADKKDNFPLLCNLTNAMGPKLEAWRDVEPQIQMPVTMATIKKAIEIGVRVVGDRRKRESKNIQQYQRPFQKSDPLYSYGQMMRAKKEAIEQAKLSSVLLEATRVLIQNRTLAATLVDLRLDAQTLQELVPQLDVREYVSNIAPFMAGDHSVAECLPQELPCDPTNRFRAHSGWCNNLRFPHYGNAFGPLRHLYPPEYADGIDAPRAYAINGERLPLARAVSNAIHVDLPYDDEKFTHMVMQFGQLLDHEMTHSPVERGPNDEILNCSRCDSPETLSVHCMPIHLPDNDPHHPTHDVHGERRCFPMARSLLGQLSLGYRNQLNQLTAFLDGSAIYGSTKCEAAELRLFSGGLMNFTNLGNHNTEALPQGDQEQDCRSKPAHPCFVAGDERNSHQPGLTTMHNIFLREHNRIARSLAAINPSWDDDRLYEETRRIIGAVFQNIVYNEYLPKLIGKGMMEKNGLNPLNSGYFAGYDPTCDASISHPFATAAFRYGHTLIRRFFPRMNPHYRNQSSPVDLQENFNNVESIYDGRSGGLDSLLVGLLGTKCMAFDRHITDAVRNHLFQIRNLPLSGFDLIALNIMRARDHGVQPYNRFREHCGLRRAHSFSDLLEEMDESAVEALRSVYSHVDDIDLFPGLLSERPMGGALMPPTMACIIAEQFQRLKVCDRFYYENDASEIRFSEEQLAEIRKITLGSVLCKNSKVLTKIQPDVFSIPDQLSNSPIPCTDFPQLNLAHWEERGSCHIAGEEVPRGSSKLQSPCVRCMCTANGPVCRAVKVFSCRSLVEHYLKEALKSDVSCMVQCAKHLGSTL